MIVVHGDEYFKSCIYKRDGSQSWVENNKLHWIVSESESAPAIFEYLMGSTFLFEIWTLVLPLFELATVSSAHRTILCSLPCDPAAGALSA